MTPYSNLLVTTTRNVAGKPKQVRSATQRVPLDEQVRGFLEYLSLLVLLRQDGVQRQQSDEEDGCGTGRYVTRDDGPCEQGPGISDCLHAGACAATFPDNGT